MRSISRFTRSVVGTYKKALVYDSPLDSIESLVARIILAANGVQMTTKIFDMLHQ